MVLGRLRLFGRREDGKLSCFGKLPLYGEFLRHRLDGREADWVVKWMDAAHHLIAGAKAATNQERELRAIVSLPGHRKLLAVLIRPSVDAKGRSYPICVFAARDARPLRGCWHLAPLWLNPIWEVIRSVVFDPSITELDTFEQALESVDLTDEDLGPSAEQFRAATNVAIEHPWQALSGTSSTDSAAGVATNFAEIADYQRTAGNDRGLAIALSAVIPPGLQGDGSEAAVLAIWIRLFSALSDREAPWPCVMELREGGAPKRFLLFGREPTPPDLAHVLADVGNSTFESLDEAGNDAPSSQKIEEIATRLIAPSSDCIQDLWES